MDGIEKNDDDLVSYLMVTQRISKRYKHLLRGVRMLVIVILNLMILKHYVPKQIASYFRKF